MLKVSFAVFSDSGIRAPKQIENGYPSRNKKKSIYNLPMDLNNSST